MKLERHASFLLGKALALIEDGYIEMKDPLAKNDFGHKLLLLKQDINDFLKEAHKESFEKDD